MENALQVYSYNEAPVRVIMRGAPATPWWVANDVCDILGYSNARKALADHLEDDEKDVTICYTPGGNQSMNIINESGLYCLILRSNMPKAKEFRKWVTGTVIPQVMRNGLPLVQEVKPAQIDPIQGAKTVFEAAKIEGNQLALALDKIYSSYTGRSAFQTAGIALIAPTQHQLLTPTDIGREFGVSARKINELLIEGEYQYRAGKSYEPTEQGSQFAVMLDTNKWHSDGTPIRQLKWDSSILDELNDRFEELSF